MSDPNPRAHRKAALRLTLCLLFVWFLLSFACGILFRDWLDAQMPTVGHAPFGFWMAQQGSILGFILILVAYAVLMNRLDSKHGYAASK